MDLFKVYCIGLQFMTEDRAVMISFSSVWNLLNFKILRILPHTQVGLPLYLANMFKAMKASCRELQAQLEENGTPNQFPKVLPARKVEWKRL